MREEHSPGRNGRRSGGLRSLIEPRFFPSFALSDNGSISGRRSFYLKLPPQGRIKLSVVKLNGSLFDVEVPKDCSVAELKKSVEQVFTISPVEGHGRVSWSHVWGHFCLCYRDQRLVNDKTSIRYLGLNDGDQLHFVRHLSIDHSPMNKRSKSPTCKRYLELEVESNANEIQIQNQNQNGVDDVAGNCYPGAQDELPAAEFKLVNLIKGWLPYAGRWGVSRAGPESRSGPSRFSLKHLGGRPNCKTEASAEVLDSECQSIHSLAQRLSFHDLFPHSTKSIPLNKVIYRGTASEVVTGQDYIYFVKKIEMTDGISGCGVSNLVLDVGESHSPACTGL